MQMWLYGTGAGAHWPKCELYESNYETRQQYNRQLKLMYDGLEAHAQNALSLPQALAEASRARSCRAIASGAQDLGWYLPKPAEGGEIRLDSASRCDLKRGPL